MVTHEGARRLGSFTVSPVGFGAARVSIEGRPDWETGVRVVMAAVDAGMTLIDTADAYCLSSSSEHGYGERLVAEALRRLGSAASGVVVATKGGELRVRGAWKLDGRPEHIRAACEASLRALDVDVIDLYQLHRPDPAVPLTDTIGAMVQLRHDGLVREIGVCNVTEQQLEAVIAVGPVVAVQNPLTYDRSRRDSVLEACERHGLAYLAHSPFGGPGSARRLGNDRRLATVADSCGSTPHAVALAALLARSPSMIPIPGTSSVQRPAGHIAAGRIELSAEDRRVLGLDGA